MREDKQVQLPITRFVVQRQTCISCVVIALAYFILGACSVSPPEGGSTPAVIIDIHGSRSPESMVVCLDGGRMVEVVIDGDFDYGFGLDHLYDHLERREPIELSWAVVQGEWVATEIRDSGSIPSGC